MPARLARFDTLLIVLVNILLLSPMLECGYTGDDALNSMMPGILAEQNTTSPGLIARQIVYWASAHGRFYPLAFYYIPFFTHVRSLFVYRLLGIGCVLFNVYLFSRLVTRWTASARMGKLAALLVPLLFQFRPYPDPIHSFCFLLQVTFMFIVASLLWIDRYVESGRRSQLVLGTASYACALLTYEIAWPFFVLAWIVMGLRSRGAMAHGRRASVVWSLGSVATAFVVMAIALRLVFHVPLTQHHGTAAEKYTPVLRAEAYVEHLVRQSASGLPLSYRFLSGDVVDGADLAVPATVLILLVFGYALTMPGLLRATTREDAGSGAVALKPLGLPGLFVAGVLGWMLPGMLIALSPVYLQSVHWGVGYLPVYISYYGVALVLLAAARGFLSLLPGLGLTPGFQVAAACGIAGICGLVAVVDFRTNTCVIQNGNRACHYPRELLENALERGLCRDAALESAIYVCSAHVWDRAVNARAFFRTYAGLPVRVFARGEYAVAGGEQAYYLRYEAPSKDMGYAIFGRATRMSADTEHIREANGNTVMIYVRGAAKSFSVSGRPVRRGHVSQADRFVFEGDQFHVLESGSDWLLCRLTIDGEIDLLSLEVRLK